MGQAGIEAHKRNTGIDALRMLAMFMVAVLHVLKQGGVLSACEPFSGQYEAAWLLEAAAYCAVNCYALISGYVGIRGKYRYTNIAELWLRVVFYSACITAAFRLFLPDTVGWEQCKAAVTPVMHGQYWYFTAYFALFFFLPILNAAANHFTQKQYAALVIGLVTVFSVLPTFFRRDAFLLDGGYSAWWLAILYVIGGYLRRFGLWERLRKGWWLALYLAAVCVSWVSKWLLESHGHDSIFISYTSPTILLAGIALLQFFKQCSFSARAARIVAVFSPAAFSVYLIHVQPLVWEYIMEDRFAAFADKPWPLTLVCVLGTAAGIYAGCSVIDLAREKLFRVLKIKKMCLQLETKYIGETWTKLQ